MVAQYIVLVALPCLSHLGCCYILVSYWIDVEGQTTLRTRTMCASIPLLVFFTIMIVSQQRAASGGHDWIDCATEGTVQQACYLQANFWQMITVFSAYRFVIEGRSPMDSQGMAALHAFCWGVPLVLVAIQALLEPDAYYDDLFQSELRGIGWCDVKSSNRAIKAIFGNLPHLIGVSFYAQFYFYIHQKVDPEVIVGFETTAKLSTSKNARLLSVEEARAENYIQATAQHLRLNMSVYMFSFMTHTLVSLINDNLTDPDEGASDATLLLQTGVVSCQGFLLAGVFARTASKSTVTAYWDTIEELIAMFDERSRKKLAEKRDKVRQNKLRNLESLRKRSLSKPTLVSQIQNGLTIAYQCIMVYPVGVWVWVPMSLISENTDNKRKIFVALVIWSVACVFPVYAFSIHQNRGAMSTAFMETMAQGFALLVIVISAVGIYANRYRHSLLMIEGPARYAGSGQSIFGPGQGFRFKSLRNVVFLFTLAIEFYQIYGLTWGATKMDDHYERLRIQQGSASGDADKLIEDQCMRGGVHCEVFIYWSVVAMVIGWVVLYTFPAVVTTSTVGNRQLAKNISEQYRKYLWFMSGAGFLTIIKSCMKILFCQESFDGTRSVTLTDRSIECWTDVHLQMVAIALLCLSWFFPTASLAVFFRYQEDDNRGCFGCVAGGEDVRWIHLWRRIEYLVKGIWVFLGMLFSQYLYLASATMLLGSFVISVANYYMSPSNMLWMTRQKLNIHICNAWTTATCVWAVTSGNESKTLHHTVCWAGWVTAYLFLAMYEFHSAHTSPYKQKVGDKFNLVRCEDIVRSHRNVLMRAVGLARWGHHARIVEIVGFCRHPDIEIQRVAFRAIADLAFADQMTTRYSFFLRLSSTDPTVQILVDAIESSVDSEIRNLATRTLNSFLQTNTSNSFGVPISFHETLQKIDDEKDGMIPVIVSKYAESCSELAHQVDAIQLALEMVQSDSNDAQSVAQNILPTLKEWMLGGTMVQQYFACQLMMFIANRSDCAHMVMEHVGVEALIELFMCMCSSYGQFEEHSTAQFESSFGFRPGKYEKAPRRLVCLTRSLPKKYKRLVLSSGDYIATGFTTDGETGNEELGVAHETTLTPRFIRSFQADMLESVVEILADCAFANDAYGKAEMLKGGVLASVVTSCLEFDSTTREGADAIDSELTSKLHVGGCRICEYVTCRGFSLTNIYNDDEMHDYLTQLRHFMTDPDAKDASIHVFYDLTATQRRKVHLVAEFLALEHESEGPPTRRMVLVSKPTEVGTSLCSVVGHSRDSAQVDVVQNPLSKTTDIEAAGNAPLRLSVRTASMDISADTQSFALSKMESLDEAETAMKQARSKGEVSTAMTTMRIQSKDSGQRAKSLWKMVGKAIKTQGQIYEQNFKAVSDSGIVRLLLRLAEKESTSNQVMYSVFDILLLLLEKPDGISDETDLSQVKRLMLDGIMNPSNGISVMCSTGANLFVIRSGLYVKWGARRTQYQGKRLFRHAAKQVYWALAWYLRTKNGRFREVTDFSDVTFGSVDDEQYPAWLYGSSDLYSSSDSQNNPKT